MTVHHIIDTTSLSVGGFARAYPILEIPGYLLSQKLWGGSLVRGYLGKGSICFGQFVYAIGRGEVGLIQLSDEGQGSNEIGGKIFSVVKEVGHGSLSIWIHRDL